MAEKHHKITYIELPAIDLTATKTFYNRVFAWEFTDWGSEYISFAGAGVDGGFRIDDEVTPTTPGPLVVLYSSDLETTEQAIVAAGCSICVPIFAFPGGRRFHFKDPNGNELAVWSE